MLGTRVSRNSGSAATFHGITISPGQEVIECEPSRTCVAVGERVEVAEVEEQPWRSRPRLANASVRRSGTSSVDSTTRSHAVRSSSVSGWLRVADSRHASSATSIAAARSASRAWSIVRMYARCASLETGRDAIGRALGAWLRSSSQRARASICEREVMAPANRCATSAIVRVGRLHPALEATADRASGEVVHGREGHAEMLRQPAHHALHLGVPGVLAVRRLDHDRDQLHDRTLDSGLEIGRGIDRREDTVDLAEEVVPVGERLADVAFAPHPDCRAERSPQAERLDQPVLEISCISGRLDGEALVRVPVPRPGDQPPPVALELEHVTERRRSRYRCSRACRGTAPPGSSRRRCRTPRSDRRSRPVACTARGRRWRRRGWRRTALP